MTFSMGFFGGASGLLWMYRTAEPARSIDVIAVEAYAIFLCFSTHSR